MTNTELNEIEDTIVDDTVLDETPTEDTNTPEGAEKISDTPEITPEQAKAEEDKIKKNMDKYVDNEFKRGPSQGNIIQDVASSVSRELQFKTNEIIRKFLNEKLGLEVKAALEVGYAKLAETDFVLDLDVVKDAHGVYFVNLSLCTKTMKESYKVTTETKINSSIL